MASPSEIQVQLGRCDEPARVAAVEALAAHVTSSWTAVRAVLDALRDESPAVRAQAARALAQRGVLGSESEVALLERLRDDNAEVRRAACASLRWVFEPTLGVSALVGAMSDDTDASVRAAAARSLGVYGRHSRLVVPALRRALHAEEGSVCAAIAEALVRRSSERAHHTEACAALRRAAKLATGPDRFRLARALMRHSPDRLERERLGQELLAPLRSDDPGPRETARRLLLEEGLHGLPPRFVADLAALDDPELREHARRTGDVATDDTRRWGRRSAQEVGPPDPAGPEAVDPVAMLWRRLSDPDGRARGSAAEALAGILKDPVAAVEVLEPLTRDPDLDARIGAARGLCSFGRAALPALSGPAEDPESLLRCEIASSLSGMQGNDALVTSILVRLLGDPSFPVRCAALESLRWVRQVGREGVRALRTCLDDPHEWVRAHAACDLAALGEGSARVREVLLQGRSHDDRRIRERCFDALLDLGDTGPETAEAVIGALEAPETSVVAHAAAAVGRLGPAGAVAIPRLIELLRHAEPEVRRGALRGLRALGPLAASAAPELLRLLDTDVSSFDLTATALAALGEPGRPLVPRLEARLREGGGVDSLLVRALARLAPVAPEARSLLVKLLHHPDGQVRSGAVHELERLRLPSAELAALLAGLLEDREPWVRLIVARALLHASQGMDEAEAALSRLLEDPDPFLRASAAGVLGDAGRGSPRLVQVLVESLTGGDPIVEVTAYPTLARLARMQASARQALRALAPQGGAEPCLELALALCEVGEADAAALHVVLGGLHASGAYQRARSAWALSRTRRPTPEAILELVESLSDADLHVRAQAAYALARWAQAPSAARQALLEGIRDPDDWIRRVSTEGLSLMRSQPIRAVLRGLSYAANRRWVQLRAWARRRLQR